MEKAIILPLSELGEEIGKAISNDTCRKILDKLSEKRHSVSELANLLGLSISTVQYNIDLLKKAGLIKESAYRFSEKGRKVIYYEPAQKIIVIAPKKKEKEIYQKIAPLFASLGFGITSILAFVFSRKVEVVEYTQMAMAPLKGGAETIVTYSPTLLFTAGFFGGISILLLALFLFRYLEVKK